MRTSPYHQRGAPTSPSPESVSTNRRHIASSTGISAEHSTHITSSPQQHHSRHFYHQSSDPDPFSFTNIPLEPPSPALTTSSGSRSSPTESSFPERANSVFRQSLSDSNFDRVKLSPLLTRASTVSSRANSPTRSQHRPQTPQSAYPSASKASTRARHSHSTSLLENFFGSYASPGPEEYPAPEDFEMDRSYTRSPVLTRPRKASTASFTNSIGEKFNWLRTKSLSGPSLPPSSPTTSVPRQHRKLDDLIEDDPLFNLDINTQLFPDGPADTLDPSSFHTLLANATTLIQTLHIAYKTRTIEHNDLSCELTAQTDELDEAETRARHLKMQLSDMSSRMADTEASLRAQLVEETQRRDAAEAQLGALQHAQKHDRAASSCTSDSGFESETESDLSSALSSPAAKDRAVALRNEPVRPHAVRRAQLEERPWNPNRATIAMPLQGGGELLGENVFLKQRVAELEAAVDACLMLL